ncbi:MAG TPA: flagellar biosynthetic protein FliO [Blastocatellia bacterium]|nr:flagellar biosynthetic protein FliO [Blastocatellia bacterium]
MNRTPSPPPGLASIVSGRLRLTPIEGAIVLVALLAVAAAGGSKPLLVAAVASVAGTMLVVRSRAGRPGSPPSTVVERISTCALGPGAAIHVVACDGQRLLVGVTGASIVVIRELPATPGPSTEPEFTTARSTSRTVMSALLLGALLLTPCTSVAGQRRESSTQRVGETSGENVPAATSFPSSTSSQSVAASQPRADIAPPVTGIGPPPYGTLALLAGLALLPFLLMAVTSFAKISIVLSLLRNALGTPQVPSDPVLAGIALALTIFVMGPVASESMRRVGSVDTATIGGVLDAAGRAAEPLMAFLKRNTRDEEIALFVELSTAHGSPHADAGSGTVLIPAFVTTELRQAFVTGFVIYLPFLVVDMVVANILMSMGMVMVSPGTVALPFKLMLFVLIDGWPLLLKGLALSYN